MCNMQSEVTVWWRCYNAWVILVLVNLLTGVCIFVLYIRTTRTRTHGWSQSWSIFWQVRQQHSRQPLNYDHAPHVNRRANLACMSYRHNCIGISLWLNHHCLWQTSREGWNLSHRGQHTDESQPPLLSPACTFVQYLPYHHQHKWQADTECTLSWLAIQ